MLFNIFFIGMIFLIMISALLISKNQSEEESPQTIYNNNSTLLTESEELSVSPQRITEINNIEEKSLQAIINTQYGDLANDKNKDLPFEESSRFQTPSYYNPSNNLTLGKYIRNKKGIAEE